MDLDDVDQEELRAMLPALVPSPRCEPPLLRADRAPRGVPAQHVVPAQAPPRLARRDVRALALLGMVTAVLLATPIDVMTPAAVAALSGQAVPP